MKIYIGADHAGFELKEKLKTYLPELGLGYEVVDLGAYQLSEGDDYPYFVTPVAKAVAEDKGAMGIVLGGSGQGEAMCANRIHGARATVFYGPENMEGANDGESFEIVRLAREHNNANIISIGARFVTEDEAKFAVELFLSTKFSDEDRHVRRLEKY